MTFLDEVYPAVAYGEPFSQSIFAQDSDFTRSIWGLYQLHAQKWALPAALFRIDEAFALGAIVYCGNPADPLLVYETYRPNDRPAVALAADVGALQHLPYEPDEGITYFLLTSAGSLNYGHFLVDDLPRLKALSTLRNNGASQQRIVILMLDGDEAINRVRRQAVALFCPDNVDIRFLDPRQTYRFRQLHYVSPVSFHPVQKNPRALDYVANIAIAAVNAEHGAEPTPSKNLFIVRSPAVGRRLANKLDIGNLLADHGFSMIETDSYSFLDQVRMFFNSDITVGQMGASMTNTLFSKNHAENIYLAPSQWVEPFYWDLAVAREQNYKVVYGDRHYANPSAYLDDFTISEQELRSVLENVLHHR